MRTHEQRCHKLTKLRAVRDRLSPADLTLLGRYL